MQEGRIVSGLNVQLELATDVDKDVNEEHDEDEKEREKDEPESKDPPLGDDATTGAFRIEG